MAWPGQLSRSLRIAYLGPPPQMGSGGVAGVAALLIENLLVLGHEIECYVAGIETPLPARLTDHAGFMLVDGRSAFRYGAWYSRTELTKFVSGQAMRALVERRLANTISSRHGRRPYDVVYQFSHIEAFNLGGSNMPQLVVHPETHTAGELRWLKLERALSRKSEPFHRRLAARAILTGRTAVQRRHVRRAAGFVCPSHAFQRAFCADYEIDPRRTRVIPNPIDLAVFRPDLREVELQGPLKVLYVSRISVRKGVDTVVELSQRLADLAGLITIEVMGAPTQWSDYGSLLGDLDPRVASFRGFVSPTEMPALMANAGLLIQPSKYEPFGLTVGEALASGLPVVVTDEVGAAENVSSECARIVPVGDVAALETQVRYFVKQLQDGDGPRLARRARAEAERLFDPRQVGESLALALEELAA
jgi:glycosyltransferase involved in cell wall biosynthesis